MLDGSEASIDGSSVFVGSSGADDRRNEQDRPDVARKCLLWKRYQHRVDPQDLVFVDEAWPKTNMTPIRG